MKGKVVTVLSSFIPVHPILLFLSTPTDRSPSPACLLPNPRHAHKDLRTDPSTHHLDIKVFQLSPFFPPTFFTTPEANSPKLIPAKISNTVTFTPTSLNSQLANSIATSESNP